MRSSTGIGYLDDRRGFALESTLIVLLLMSTLAVIAFAGAVTSIRTTNIDYRNARVGYASEAGAEGIMAQIDVQLQDGVLTDAELAALTPPVLPGFTVDSFRAVKVGGIVQETITQGPFVGMYSLTQNIDIQSSVRDASNNRSAVVVSVKAQAIPIFQFAAFWEGDLEEYAGPTKHIYGRVHGNGNLHLGGNDNHFHDPVTTPNKVRRDHKQSHKNPEDATINVYIYNAAGAPVKLDFDSEEIPGAVAFRAQSDAKFNGRLKTDAYGVDSLRLPLPAGIVPRELIRPREASDTPEEQEVKFGWQADMYVTVDLTNRVAFNSTCSGASTTKHPTITVVRYDGGPVPTNAAKCNIFKFKFDAFGDRHDWRWVDALTVELDTLRTWLTGVGGPKPDVIYIEFKKPTVNMTDSAATDPAGDNPGSGGGMPFLALRLRDGFQLHGRLSIGSEYPLYVRGDYNTTAKQPAAVFGDTYTWLSTNYPDGGYPSPGQGTNGIPSMPVAVNVTHNFAIVTGTGAGYVGCYHEVAGCVPPADGGAGWFRSLEDATGKTFTFRGSFVSLWAPVYATVWDMCQGQPTCGDHYKRPNRVTQFETMFLWPDSLPPATPVVGNVIHTAYRPVY